MSHLIVGAGPVGLTMALELHRRGITSTIIDNDGEPTPESRALAINPRTLEILEPSGVTERLINAGNKLEGIIIRKNDQTILTIDLTDISHRHNYLLTLPQSQTEEILIEALKEQDIAIDWHTALTAVEPTSDSFLCTLNKNDQTKDLKTKYLIGADGAHSTVRKALDFSFSGESIPDEWSLADVHVSEWPYPFNHAVATFTEHGPIAFFPLSEGFGRLVSSQPDVLNNLPKGMKVEKVTWQSSFKISYRQVSTYQKGNAFLAGDAAHIHSPAGGRGMNMGIEDAATLAFLMAENKTQKYTELRHPIGEKILAMTKQQTNQLTKPGPLFDLTLKYIAPLILAIPPIKTKALSRITGLDSPTPEWL